ncbi:MAG: hypothetical protein ACYCWE_18810 [Eubacteriales bacterium]
MKKKLLALTLAFILVLGFSGAVYAVDGAVIDQSNEGSWVVSSNISQLMPIGQEFVPSQSLLAGVEISIQGYNYGGPADMTVNIRESAIYGTVIASKTIYAVDGYYNGWLYFEFSSPAAVTPGLIYVFEIQTSNESHYLKRTFNTYPAGDMIINGVINDYYDAIFRTYTPEMIIPVNNVTPMAAPNIAEIILQAEGVEPNQSTGTGKDRVSLNLIVETANHMEAQTLFDGIEISVLNDEGTEVCNPAYWDAVLAFLNSYGFSFDYTLYDYIAAQP